MSFAFGSNKLALLFGENRAAALLLSALVGFGLSIFLIGNLVFSGYSILDDHDVVDWFGPDHHLAFSRLWPTLMSTEVGQYGPGARFRPVMYSLSVFQTWLWGPHPAGYHVVAILWFSIFLWAVAWACFRSIGVIAGCAVLFLIANGHYWGNIFTHSTMVSEQPALLGLALVIFGFGLTCTWFLNGCRARIDAAVLLVSIGGLICIGAKENFMPPAWLGIALLAWAWRLKKIETRTLAISSVLCLLSLAVCARIIIPNLGQATDMYGYDSHVGHRLRAIYHSPLFRDVLVALGAGTVAAALGARDMMRRDGRDPRAIITLGAFLIIAGLYLAWEIFFYNGRLPFGQRYDFPALMIYPIFAGAAFFAVMQARKHSAWLTSRFSPPALQLCFVLLIMNVATAAYVGPGLLPVMSAIAISNSHTQKMAADLRATRILTAQHPDWPILVVATRPLNYEPVVTLPTWLNFFGIPNAASVVVDVQPQFAAAPFEKMLVAFMQKISTHGAKGRYAAMSASTEKGRAEGRCYIITFEDYANHCIPLPYRPEGYFPVD